MNKAIIFTLPNCRWCDKAKKLLKLKGVEYTEVLEKYDGHPTVPYVILNEVPIGGFTELAYYFRNH